MTINFQRQRYISSTIQIFNAKDKDMQEQERTKIILLYFY